MYRVSVFTTLFTLATVSHRFLACLQAGVLQYTSRGHMEVSGVTNCIQNLTI